MKHGETQNQSILKKMPPTRGHDLKLPMATLVCPAPPMPPTRGHDLKHVNKAITIKS